MINPHMLIRNREYWETEMSSTSVNLSKHHMLSQLFEPSIILTSEI